MGYFGKICFLFCFFAFTSSVQARLNRGVSREKLPASCFEVKYNIKDKRAGWACEKPEKIRSDLGLGKEVNPVDIHLYKRCDAKESEKLSFNEVLYGETVTHKIENLSCNDRFMCRLKARQEYYCQESSNSDLAEYCQNFKFPTDLDIKKDCSEENSSKLPEPKNSTETLSSWVSRLMDYIRVPPIIDERKILSQKIHQTSSDITYNLLGMAGKVNKGREVMGCYPRGEDKEVLDNLVHQAFEDVTDCLNFSQRDKEFFYMLLHQESSLILNARSSQGAMCLGQILNEAIADVNNPCKYPFNPLVFDNEFDCSKEFEGEFPYMPSDKMLRERNKKSVSKGSPKSCNKLKTLVRRIDFEDVTVLKEQEVENGEKVQVESKVADIQKLKEECELFENPYTCLYYSAAFYKVSQQISKNKFSATSKEALKNSKKLTEKQKNHKITIEFISKGLCQGNEACIKEFLDLFAVWGYNPGHQKLYVQFGSFLKELIDQIDQEEELLKSEEIYARVLSQLRDSSSKGSFNYRRDMKLLFNKFQPFLMSKTDKEKGLFLEHVLDLSHESIDQKCNPSVSAQYGNLFH